MQAYRYLINAGLACSLFSASAWVQAQTVSMDLKQVYQAA